MGKVRAIKDMLVKVEFLDEMPELGEVVIAQNEAKAPLVVDSFIDDTTAACLNIRSSVDLYKGMDVMRTYHGIEVPTGPETIGRILDAMGEPLDKMPLPEGLAKKNIFEIGKGSEEFKARKPEILETGIRVIDFFTPFVKGRKIGIIGVPVLVRRC